MIPNPFASNTRQAIFQEMVANRHQPGKTFTFSDGIKYTVLPNGVWMRITPKRGEIRRMAKVQRG